MTHAAGQNSQSQIGLRESEVFRDGKYISRRMSSLSIINREFENNSKQPVATLPPLEKPEREKKSNAQVLPLSKQAQNDSSIIAISDANRKSNLHQNQSNPDIYFGVPQAEQVRRHTDLFLSKPESTHS